MFQTSKMCSEHVSTTIVWCRSGCVWAVSSVHLGSLDKSLVSVLFQLGGWGRGVGLEEFIFGRMVLRGIWRRYSERLCFSAGWRLWPSLGPCLAFAAFAIGFVANGTNTIEVWEDEPKQSRCLQRYMYVPEKKRQA